MGPSWGHVGPMLALGPLKQSTQKTFQKTHTKRKLGALRCLGGGPLEQRKKKEKGYQGEKKMQKTPHMRTRRGGGYVRMYVCMHVCMYVFMYMCCIYVCPYVCMYVCMYVCN